MKFDYTNKIPSPTPSPEYNKKYGSFLPAVQARSNMSYLQFIDIVNYLWSKGHSDVMFQPFSAQKIFDPELGYIIYSLEDKKPRANNPRPRLYDTQEDPEDPKKKIAIFIENFNIIVQFTALHKDPRIAEELIEEFENFILEITPSLRMNGLESISYVRRMPDSHQTRFGDDISARAIAYMIGVQKILVTDMNVLEEVSIAVQAIVNNHATPSYSSATPSYNIYTTLLDNGI